MSGLGVMGGRAAPTPVRGLSIDPRIQARLNEVRRERVRRLRRMALAAAAGVTVVAAGWVGTRTPLLAVRHVAVTGAGHTSRAAVLAAAGLDHHRQMLDLSPAHIRAGLEALPWVSRAKVARHWPGTVDVTISERSAVARVAGPAGQSALVDAQGRVLATGSEAATAIAGDSRPLPSVTGLPVAASAGDVVSAGRDDPLALAVALERALGAVPSTGGPTAGGRATLQTVAVAPDGTLRAQMASGLSVVFGSDDQLAAKLVAVGTVVDQVDLAGVSTIDVRVPDTPVLTRTNGGGIVSTIPRG